MTFVTRDYGGDESRNGGDGIIVYDAESGVVYDADERFCEMTGYGADEVASLSIDAFDVDGEGLGADETGLRGREQTAGSTLDGRRISTKDGDPITVAVTRSSLTVDGTTCVRARVREATDRAERSEREQKLLRALFEESPGGLLVHDADGSIVDANRRVREHLGYAREELLSMTVFDVETGVSPDRLREKWASMSVGERLRIEGVHRRKDGSTVSAEIRVSKIGCGEEPWYVALCLDIAERKRHEHELERYQRLVENLPVGVYRNTPGPDGEFRLVNEAMVDLFDAESKEDLLERPVSDLYADTEQRAAFSSMLADRGVVKQEELKLETLGDETLWGAVTAVAVDDATVFEGAIEDITERKEYEQRLRRQRDNLEVLNQVVRHDIRNDLQIVIAYLDQLAGSTDADEEYVEKALTSAEHAVELTTSAREIADVMLQSESDLGPVPLGSVLEDEIEQIRSAHPDAVVSMEGTVPDATVLADEMLDSVCRNLLENAIQHNDEDVPEVAVTVTDHDDSVVVSVADNGPGVPDGRKEAIFGKGERSLASSGTGIGLYLVNTLVDRYGGEVWVEDNEPEGAVFALRLSKAGER